MTNANVVPCNLFILAKYGSHSNLEWIGDQHCLEYVLKYVMKGHDMSYVRLSGSKMVDYDEFVNHFKVR